jgi:predicted dehydrogenase
MKKKILLVGCGNIGSRHLQGLIKLQNTIEVNVVEPDDNAQKIAKTRIHEIKNIKKFPKITWFKNINELKQKSDLVIIATHSKGRLDLISTLLDQGNKRFLLEKMVCQSKSEYLKILEKMEKSKANSWVNTPRRYFKSYQKIKKLFADPNLILTVDAGNLGLGSNAIHILDLFSWFIDDYHLTLNGDSMNKKILLNKRGKDFVEFSGTLTGKSKTCAFVSITFHSNQNIPFTLMLVRKNMKLILNETDSKIMLYTGKEKLYFETDFVSTITNKITNDILKKNSCLLPTLENSFITHTELFRIFNQHLKKIQHLQPKLCPIT